MAGRSHILGSPPAGGRFRLVLEDEDISFVGILTVGLEEHNTEREEEVNLTPGTGTRVVFEKEPQLQSQDGTVSTFKTKECVLCKIERGSGTLEFALLFPHGAFLLKWFVPEQNVRLYPEKKSNFSSNHYHNAVTR